jgi:hypothetical protein
LKYSTLIEDMITEGATPEMILVAVRAVERQETDALERRRAADRARQERHRTNPSRDKTLRNVSHGLSRSHAGVEDKTSSTVIEPQESKNSTPAAPSPRQHLETVLTTEQAEAVLQHRKSIKAPLTQRSAKLLATELAKCPDPNAAADTMMLRGWRGFEASWLVNPPRAGPAPKLAPMDHFRNYANEISDGQIRDDRGNGGDWDDAPGVPLRAIQHHG